MVTQKIRYNVQHLDVSFPDENKIKIELENDGEKYIIELLLKFESESRFESYSSSGLFFIVTTEKT